MNRPKKFGLAVSICSIPVVALIVYFSGDQRFDWISNLAFWLLFVLISITLVRSFIKYGIPRPLSQPSPSARKIASRVILPARILGILFLISALIPASLAAWFYHSTSAFIHRATSTAGTVVDLQPSSREGTAYTAVYEFVDAAGVRHRSNTSWSSSPPQYAIGEHIEVLYSLANPADACIRSFVSLWLLPTICAAFCIGQICFGIICIHLAPWLARDHKWPHH